MNGIRLNKINGRTRNGIPGKRRFQLLAAVCVTISLLVVPAVSVSASTSGTVNPAPSATSGGLAATTAVTAATGSITVGSAQIIEEAKELDGKVIVYEGEVIGDIMARGDHVWVNVSDGANAVGIWMSAEQAKALSIPGRYKMRGDMVRITGQFNRACAEHGGDYDIHASAVIKLAAGFPINHPLHLWLVVVSILLSLGAACVLLIYRRKKTLHVSKWPRSTARQQ